MFLEKNHGTLRILIHTGVMEFHFEENYFNRTVHLHQVFVVESHVLKEPSNELFFFFLICTIIEIH